MWAVVGSPVGDKWEKGGLCSAGSASFAGDAEEGKCPQSRGLPEPAMTPQGAPHLCNALNPTEQL